MWKQHRLTRPTEFQRVRRNGKAASNSWVVVYALPNATAVTRYGFSINKRLGMAVTRNRVRRRLREIIRSSRGEIRPGWDLVIIARQRAALASYQDLQTAVRQALQRIGVMAARGLVANESDRE